MKRIPEPELMDDPVQARAYADADFEQPHNMFMSLWHDHFDREPAPATVLDLGCGAADISIRFARAYPNATIDAVDGADAMLEQAQRAVEAADCASRIRLHCAHLPSVLPRPCYDAVISNSLLHHLADPHVLWDAVAAALPKDGLLLVMDLLRPASPQAVDHLVAQYAAGEPAILQRDFRHSLYAAYRHDEVRAQLERSGLADMHVEVVSDRHLLVWGRRR